MPPDMPPTWFTAERLVQFWGYVKWFLAFNMPMFMIVMAVIVVGHVCDMIIDTFQEAKGKDKNDDDDIDVKYY